jgi:tetratricopeptide (TPR) repeat protein
VVTAGALGGLARELLGRGVPAVVAMTAPVTDRYATWFAAETYRELAAREDPVPLGAVSDARRAAEARRRALPAGDPWAVIAEWATPVLMQAGPAMALFRRADGLERLEAASGPVFGAGMVVRRVGEFVGRRAELRALLRVLRGDGAGVVVHGIGGVGKSTLAAQLVEQLGGDAGLLVAVSGAAALTVDLIFEALRTALAVRAIEHGLDDRDPLRQVAAILADASPPWPQRLELVRQIVLPRLGVLLLVDNAEDLLTPPDGHGERDLADSDLAGLLAGWVQAGPGARLLVTSRYPFTLPGGLARRLAWHHLGPLSLAETRKLIWRLPALDTLDPAGQQRAHAMVGGHPRTLEYLDALLRGGQAAFPDVAARLEAALGRRGIPDPRQWLQGVEGDLDKALAETITLAADDVLLDDLLATLHAAPTARDLISRAAVYRRPVDDTGIAWQLSSLTTVPDLPAGLITRLQPLLDLIEQARQAGTGDTAEDLDPGVVDQYRQDLAELARPPVSLATEGRQALGLLAALGLIAPASEQDTGAEDTGNQDTVGGEDTGGEDEGPGWIVHRWTAAALEARATPEELTAAHRRAAAYWRWRVAAWPQSRARDVEQLLEARYHHHAAGDLDQALDANRQACAQLRTWGAWTTEHQLREETLTWVPPDSARAAAIHISLGELAQNRGDYPAAEQHYHTALAIFDELGDRNGLASSYHHLGMLAQNRGDYDTAEQHYQEALAIAEELGNRASASASYHQLGMLAEIRGDYDTAEQRYQASLAIDQELGDRQGVGKSYHQLGILAEDRGDYDTAEQRYQASLAIDQELGDRQGVAISYHQLGNLAYSRGDYDTAEQRYQASLAINEELGDRAGIASTYGQLGILAYSRGDYDTAEQRYQACLAISEELGDRASISSAYHQLGILAQDRGDYDTAEQRYQASLAISEELGNRVGIAGTYGQLGILAQDRGDYDTAEQRYQASLAINQELGNLADSAIALSHLGVLLTGQGRPADAVGYQLQALAIRAQIGLADAAAIDVRRLCEQRAALGDQQFHRILQSTLDAEDTATIMQLTEQEG